MLVVFLLKHLTRNSNSLLYISSFYTIKTNSSENSVGLITRFMTGFCTAREKNVKTEK